MAVNVYKLPDEPIIIVVYRGEINNESCILASNQCIDIIANMSNEPYRVIDIREADETQNSVLSCLGQIYKNDEPCTYDVYVGTPKQLDTYNNPVVFPHPFLRSECYGKMFTTMEQAMQHIIAHIAQDSSAL